MAGDRQPCPCPCGCGCSTGTSGPCWLCREDTHSPGPVIRLHLAAGAEEWKRILANLTPDSSSGISRKALTRAAETWQAWHSRKPCPVTPR